jgi:hydroxypyruvate isomerase
MTTPGGPMGSAGGSRAAGTGGAGPVRVAGGVPPAGRRWRLAGNLGFLFDGVEWAARPAAARDAGLRFVEFPWPPDPDGLAVALAAAGVRPVLVNVAAGDLAAGDRGFGHLPGRVGEWRDALDAALAFAVRTGCPILNVLAGIAQPDRAGSGSPDRVGGGPVGEQRRCLSANLRWAGPRAAAVGVRLVVEACNATDSPGYLAPRVADVVELLDAAGTPEVGVQVDTYHCGMSGDDPVEWVRRLGARLGHVQLADHPGRHEPGTGRLDLAGVLAALRETGYAGAVGLEYVPDGVPVSEVVRQAEGLG